MRVKDLKCTAEGCDKLQLAKGLCQTHYHRLRRTGTLADPQTPSWFERAIEKTRKEGDCWVFLGAKGGGGYGVIKVDGRQHILTRLSFNELVEPLRPGMFVCHKCDNRACWNPDHLFQGTHDDNMRDMVLKGRSDRTTGEKKHTSKLSNSDVSSIKQLLRQGLPQRKVAAIFNVSQSCIGGISLGRRWTHVS